MRQDFSDREKKIPIKSALFGGGWVVRLPVPGRPSDLADSRARAYCACSGCGWGLIGYFYSHLSFLCSFSLSLGEGPI